MKKNVLAVIAAVLLLANFSIAVAQQAVVPSVNTVSNKVATYRAAITGITLASSPTDIFRISGSATKTVYIKSITVGGYKTSAGNLIIGLFKRSTANTQGTEVALTEHPLDSGDAAATAVAVAYTANTTVGTGVVIGAKRAEWHAANLTGTVAPTVWEFGGFNPARYVVLRGAAQGLAINLGGVTQTGGVATVEVEWMEM
jgi:hypothetical protein